MTTYFTKCGRTFEKSTKAVVTGYEVPDEWASMDNVRKAGRIKDDECRKCPWPVEVTEGYPPTFKRYECQAGSQPPNHQTTWRGSLNDKNTLNIYSLDVALMTEIIAFAQAHPDLSAVYNADSMADCRRTISVSCSGNKKGMAAKQELIDKFFPDEESTPDPSQNYDRKPYWKAQEKIKEEPMKTKTTTNTCGICGNYTPTGNEIGDCEIMQQPVSQYRPADDCIDLKPQEIKADAVSTKATLINISTNRISSHPDNPRKDLGDLTELAESIKARGILQNLTVVPKDGMNSITDFTVVIGHRRLAAAKLAGLDEVPCVISNMDYKDQLGTMLLENIQRNDLTIYEQAHGFQMMIDLGESVNEISAQTGFSETTIRRRVKLMELDQDKLVQAMERGGTLMDYAELEKLTDTKLKAKVLDTIGTSNFKWTLDSAIAEEKRPAKKAALLEFLNTFAKQAKTQGSMSYEKYFRDFELGDWKKPKDADKGEYYYIVNATDISLYKKQAKAAPVKKTDAEKAYAVKEAQFKELTTRAYDLRLEFVRTFTATKKHQQAIHEFVLYQMMNYGSVDKDRLIENLGIEKPDCQNLGWDESSKVKQALIHQQYIESPEKVLFMAAYLKSSDTSSNGYYSAYSWQSKVEHRSNNGSLDMIYNTLVSLGYEMSDEEKQLQDGTHELFDKKEETPKAEPDEIQNAEEGLFYCTQENCPFYAYDTDGGYGCGFEQEDEDSEDFFQDMQEAILTHECQNPEVKTKYDEMFEEADENEEEA